MGRGMAEITEIIGRYSDAIIAIDVAGPPDYDCGRIIINGDPAGFRLVAEILSTMADTVDSPEHPARVGWSLGINSDGMPQLRIEDAILRLDCFPADNFDPPAAQS